MAIIFNEIEHGRMLDELDDGSISKVKDIISLIKYYRYENMSEEEIKSILYKKVCGLNTNRIKIAFDYCKYKIAKEPKEIIIYKEELDEIKKEKNYNYQKYLFVCLCLCKYMSLNRDKNKNVLYVKNGTEISETRLITLSGCKVNKEEKGFICNDLYNDGFIEPKLGRWDLLYYRDSGTEAMKFIPYNEMVYEYRSYIGENVVRCERCGDWVYKRSNRTKYCSKCAKVVSNEQHKEMMKNTRNENVTN